MRVAGVVLFSTAPVFCGASASIRIRKGTPKLVSDAGGLAYGSREFLVFDFLHFRRMHKENFQNRFGKQSSLVRTHFVPVKNSLRTL